MAELVDLIRDRINGFWQGAGFVSPNATQAAVLAVLDLHTHDVWSAGVTDGKGKDGHCYYCRARDEKPIRVYRDYLNGAKTQTWMHDHKAPEPRCSICTDELYPCNTVVSVAKELGLIAAAES